MSEHVVVYADDTKIICRCGHLSLTRFGHQAHADRHPADTNDPTEDPLFNPDNWTGTVLSGVIRSHSECGVCGVAWVDGHDCELSDD